MNRCVRLAMGLSAIAVLLGLSACGSASPGAKASNVPPATIQATSSSPTGYSTDCRTASLDWATKTQDMVTGFALGDSGADLSDSLSMLTNQIQVACGKTSPIWTAVAKANLAVAQTAVEVQMNGQSSTKRIAPIMNAIRNVQALAQ